MNESDIDDNEPKTIDDAIKACEKIISRHQLHSRIMLGVLAGVVFAFYYAFKYLELIREKIPGVGDVGGMIDPKINSEFIQRSATYPYLIFALFLATLGIIVALYRFHMNEIVRNEQLKIGFWRIRIAARNTTAGFQTEVRQSLTKDAFNFNPKNQKEKGKEIESPIQGHPASDFATAVLNKILDNLDVTVKKKEKD
jgi:hypothetical protein